jgi:hypothetical protein
MDRMGFCDSCQGTAGFVITGPGKEVLGLERAKPSFLHVAPHPRRTAVQPKIPGFVMNPAVAIAPPVLVEHAPDAVTEHFVVKPGGGFPSSTKATTWSLNSCVYFFLDFTP